MKYLFLFYKLFAVLPSTHLLMHVVEKLSFPILWFTKEGSVVDGRVDYMPMPMVSIDSNVLSVVGQLVFRIQNVSSFLNINDDIALKVYDYIKNIALIVINDEAKDNFTSFFRKIINLKVKKWSKDVLSIMAVLPYSSRYICFSYRETL